MEANPIQGSSLPTPGGVSRARHDLRDKLAAIQGYGEMLYDWPDVRELIPWRAGLGSINQTCAQLILQLNQTLDWSRIEHGLSDLGALQNSIRTLSQLVCAMAENLGRELSETAPPAAVMVSRYGSAARKLVELSERVLTSYNPSEDWGSLPLELHGVEPDENLDLGKRREGVILVADDLEENRELLRQRLEWKGYTVHTVDNGNAVLAFVQTREVDVILLDLIMPGLNGFQTLQRLKANPVTNHLPVIMLSSADGLATVIRSIQFGADDFLTKPFSPILLSARVESSLAKKRLRERERSFYEHTLGLHLGRGRARQILANPLLLQPGAVKQELSFLFSDISNFSLIADRAAPDRLFKLLNKYYHATITSIHDNQGTVVKLIGDAIFAIWNAPEAQGDHQMLACRAAWALRQRLIQFNLEIKDTSDDRLATRLGIHSGEACVGNLGSQDRFEYTAIGANANLAARLEGLNKYLGTEILLTEGMDDAARAAGFFCRPVGRFKFKGLDKIAKVCELLGERSAFDPEPAWVGRFAKALGHFNYQEFSEARRCFGEALQLRGGADGASRFYLRQIEKLENQDLDGDWFGLVQLDGK